MAQACSSLCRHRPGHWFHSSRLRLRLGFLILVLVMLLLQVLFHFMNFLESTSTPVRYLHILNLSYRRVGTYKRILGAQRLSRFRVEHQSYQWMNRRTECAHCFLFRLHFCWSNALRYTIKALCSSLSPFQKYDGIHTYRSQDHV
jgi:hypothetical protein